MKEQNRLRLGRLAERYARRKAEVAARDQEGFAREFEALRTGVLRPLMEELAGELRAAGHDPVIVEDEGPEKPGIELRLGLRGAAARGGGVDIGGCDNAVGFAVIRRDDLPFQILAYLVVHPPPFDLHRFAGAADLGPDQAEQVLIDAIEHVIACATP